MTNEEIREALRNFDKVGGHGGNLGIRFVTSGDDWSEFALDYRPELTISSTNSLLASGPIISLIDQASGGSILVASKSLRACATLDLRIDYLRAAPPGKTVVARATCYRLTRNVAFVRAEAHDGDPADPVARSQATFFFTGA